MTFQLDTSGVIYLPDATDPDDPDFPYTWDILSPLEQGYVEALFASLFPPDDENRAAVRAKYGWVCNWTGGHCPSGCRAPCTDKRDGTLTDGIVSVTDYNLRPAFHMLSPEALDLIRRDCDRMKGFYAGEPSRPEGSLAWAYRQAGKFLQFPRTADLTPLTPYLSDDGKVCLRESGQ